MVEYRTFFLSLKLILNILTPIPLLWVDRIILIPYITSISFLVFVLSFIQYKKITYFNKYLSREYIPSVKLALASLTIDSIIIGWFFYCLYDSYNKALFVFNALKGIFCFIHISSTLLIFILTFSRATRSKAVISYTRHQYKIGIVARDMGNGNGLRKGQPVEILNDSGQGYIVKDSSNNNYNLAHEDIESILDVV